VAHVSTANPINLELQKFLANSCEKLGFSHGVGGTYLCIEGPQFSSKAESALYRSFGATVIGMTNVPESYLAKEAGIAYATVAMVTDYDCWKEEHCTVEEIMKVAAVNNKRVQELIMDVVPALNQNKFEVHSETEGAIMTPYDSLSSDQKRIVDTLLK
jgi:5'-methylthioadenosine phosphorylase